MFCRFGVFVFVIGYQPTKQLNNQKTNQPNNQLNRNLPRAVAAVMLSVINDAELSRRNTMDRAFGMYNVAAVSALLYYGLIIVGSVTNLEGDVSLPVNEINRCRQDM